MVIMKKSLLFLVASLLLAAGTAAGCAGPAATGSTSPSIHTSAAANVFTWPEALHFAATGSSGEAKMTSWASVMEADLGGPLVRVATEAAWTNTYRDMAAADMVLSQLDNATFSDCVQGVKEYASADGGPWMAGLVWVDSLAATGFMVRGNSAMHVPEDIKPGTKIAIWNDNVGTMAPFLSLLAWAGVSKDDIVWVNTGDYNMCVQAVIEGRADLCMAAPVIPAVMEAAAAPGGIRYISMNPQEDPEGAKAFLALSPLYSFGPIPAGPASAVGTWAVVSYKYLASNMSTDPELVYNMAKWLDENYDKYKDSYSSNTNMTLQDLIKVLQTTYIPVHPGLVKYLKEKGIWNADYENRNQTNIALLQRYCDAYAQASDLASKQGMQVNASSNSWIAFWENYKAAMGIPLIRMHVSLTQDAEPVMPAGYVPPETTAAAATTAPPASTSQAASIPFEVVSISDAHPGDDVTVTVRTVSGAEVQITFIMPNGTKSAFPSDNVKTAGADGTITWTWNINSHVPAGEATYSFTVKSGGDEMTTSVSKVI
jgi:TRAP transporter TAXI family solute receptor